MKLLSTFLNLLFFIATLSLTACGGGSPNSGAVNNNSHPEFFRNKATESPRYEPSGDITQTVPTFSWTVIENATEYRFGHESANDASDWREYTLSSDQVGCHVKGDTCLYIPTDYTFPLYVEKVWWVQAKVNGEWQDWSRPIVFTIVNQGGGYTGDIPQGISPDEESDTLTPEFSWSSIDGAINYKLGFENADDEDSWKSYLISAVDCQIGVCTYQPSNPGIFNNESVAWWVKAQSANGSWSDWSETTKFIAQGQNQALFIFNVTIDPQNVQNPSKQFSIRTLRNANDYSVDCNSDGVLEAEHQRAKYTCKYGSYGTYTITISGLFKGLRLIPIMGIVANHQLKKFEVLQWGSAKWETMSGAFANTGFQNNDMKVIFSALDTPNLSKPNLDMTAAFFGLQTFNEDISNWDVSNVTNMGKLFSHAPVFNQDISNWDVSNVVIMANMFSHAETFNQDIGNWDVSNVVYMEYMLYGASAFDQDISNWDVSNVVIMKDMLNKPHPISTSNYDNLLIGWSQLDLQSGVDFSVGTNTKYSAAAANARDTLINDFDWIISDGGEQ